jgi:hypothetical protein
LWSVLTIDLATIASIFHELTETTSISSADILLDLLLSSASSTI